MHMVILCSIVLWFKSLTLPSRGLTLCVGVGRRDTEPWRAAKKAFCPLKYNFYRNITWIQLWYPETRGLARYFGKRERVYSSCVWGLARPELRDEGNRPVMFSISYFYFPSILIKQLRSGTKDSDASLYIWYYPSKLPPKNYSKNTSKKCHLKIYKKTL